MTAKEAIQRIRNHNEIHSEKEPYFAVHITEALNMAVEALEKQISKKPIKQIWIDDEKHKGDVRLATKDDVLTKDNHDSINLCPDCKEWVMRYKYLRPPRDKDYYCRHCGQALDWSDAE